MSRAIFSVMAGLLCTLAGIRHAASIKADAERLSRWIQLLTHLKLLLTEGFLSLPEALLSAADMQRLPDSLLRDMAARIQASPLLSLHDAYLQCSGDHIEQESLSRLFSRLGRGTKENRLLALEQSIAELELLASSAAQKAAKDSRLWLTLGMTGGICLTLFLL